MSMNQIGIVEASKKHGRIKMTEIRMTCRNIQNCESIAEAVIFLSLFKSTIGTINETDSPCGKKLLHWAICSDDKNWLVEFLLGQEDIDVNVVDLTNETPLLIACRNNNLAVVRALALKRADPEIYDHNGDSALLWACYSGHSDVVKYLVEEMKVDVDHPYKDGRNALMWSCKQNNYELVQYLYHKTDCPNLRDLGGLAAYDLTRNFGIKTLIQKEVYLQQYELVLLFYSKRDHILFEKNIARDVLNYFSF